MDAQTTYEEIKTLINRIQELDAMYRNRNKNLTRSVRKQGLLNDKERIIADQLMNVGVF